MKFSKGFTLIEVIITIVIMAIAAATFVAYFGTSFTGSAMQAGQVQKQYALIQNMEEITSDYRSRVDTGMDAAQWTAFQNSCSARCTCTPSTTIGTYTTATQHLQVTCADGDQNVFAIFTQ
jgi:prepilin-type N-terminal cleavage/methylation domain-containing protein